MSGVSHGLGLGLGLSRTVELWLGLGLGLGLGLWFLYIVELWFWCLQGLSLLLGGCCKFHYSRTYGYAWLYFIHALVSGVSHGLGLGLGLSNIAELWFWCLQHPSLSLG